MKKLMQNEFCDFEVAYNEEIEKELDFRGYKVTHIASLVEALYDAAAQVDKLSELYTDAAQLEYAGAYNYTHETLAAIQNSHTKAGERLAKLLDAFFDYTGQYFDPEKGLDPNYIPDAEADEDDEDLFGPQFDYSEELDVFIVKVLKDMGL